ncbi:xanthine dehydrogenase family protein molybdopterin-binding subunit [Bradyrhizobium sp. AUGA SZCCT0182]|uniref:xanthine dehydrogenase family protein molybdopterin-binding subunit n=1 Tax=Bradyrhizobium sp. AUGA SZCCT0182 TaxID=2807667 RepID=UPI001BAC375D|nr:xanthine dehydrogenase family protein molybdopterin-binding subunit [Bradyrhizobium sp. AUGA SZCCT0182]MBR1235910.1 xanthine dehydrogenase family protein molybdopterin-binding subunit [Bradyrhizobium sp. AUGA SZCCT0182]
MRAFGIGQPVRRLEDKRFLTGSGRYVDDLRLPRECQAYVLLSPHANARILRVDTSVAKSMPGVIQILTGHDAKDAQFPGMPPLFMPEDMGGPKGFRTQRPILAYDRVRCLGDRVAVVIAETLSQARDAAEEIAVEYEPLPAVIRIEDAVRIDAPTVWDECPGNVSFTLEIGDEQKTAATFERAAHRIRLRLENNRIAANPMETRAAIGDYNAADDDYTLYTSSQAPHAVRQQVSNILGVTESRIRVISPDVGGGFGLKSDAYPEDILVLWGSAKCGRPVRWTSSRSDALLSDHHARDQVVTAELALDAQGKILAIRAHALHGVGAYIVAAGVAPLVYSLRYTPGAYDVQTVHLTTRAVFTNTSPINVYRGAGRPEGNYVIERLLDRAAHEIGLSPLEIRRRNLIPALALPYATATGSVYDSGEFERLMDRCAELSDWHSYAQRLTDSRRSGKLRGRSIAYYIEHAGIFNERMDLRFDPGGNVTILAGTHSHGQGHATVFTQMVSEWLGIPFESIRFVQGDTDKVPFGRGTYAARSALLGGVALRRAADQIIEKARLMAAQILDASGQEVEFRSGHFLALGTNRTISLIDTAKAFFSKVGLPLEFSLGLDGSGTSSGDIPNYPNGCHVCEVEIDPSTGETRIVRYTVVDDVGNPLNPMICEGQVHGGIAQGIGQALLEHIVYDPNDGQLLSGSFMDYAMPRASDFCDIKNEFCCVPSTTNPLGVKGVGESGTIGSPPAVMNAIIDALRPLGIDHLDMPATPQRVWTEIHRASLDQ